MFVFYFWPLEKKEFQHHKNFHAAVPATRNGPFFEDGFERKRRLKSLDN